MLVSFTQIYTIKQTNTNAGEDVKMFVTVRPDATIKPYSDRWISELNLVSHELLLFSPVVLELLLYMTT